MTVVTWVSKFLKICGSVFYNDVNDANISKTKILINKMIKVYILHENFQLNLSKLGKLKFRINFLKNLFFSKKIFFKFNKLTLKSVEANFVSKCFTFFLVRYKKIFLKI